MALEKVIRAILLQVIDPQRPLALRAAEYPNMRDPPILRPDIAVTGSAQLLGRFCTSIAYPEMRTGPSNLERSVNVLIAADRYFRRQRSFRRRALVGLGAPIYAYLMCCFGDHFVVPEARRRLARPQRANLWAAAQILGVPGYACPAAVRCRFPSATDHPALGFAKLGRTQICVPNILFC